MTQQEMKSNLEERSKFLEEKFEQLFTKVEICGQTCFACPDGSLFTLDYLVPFGALVLGHADNETEAELNQFEDGDLFYLENMDEEAMFQAMLNEIE